MTEIDGGEGNSECPLCAARKENNSSAGTKKRGKGKQRRKTRTSVLDVFYREVTS